jgi:hypothetical protein
MPSLQLYAGISSFETISPAFKSGQNWRLKKFPLVPSLVFRLMMKNFRKLSFGTPFKKIFSSLDFKKGWHPYVQLVKEKSHQW